MIGIKGITEIPNECHECPFQLKFKDDEADEWYNRRCVIKRQTIEYPRPNWCPLVEVPNAQPVEYVEYYDELQKEWGEKCGNCGGIMYGEPCYCPFCGTEVKR